MATISTSIKLVDGMSPALRAANSSLKALLNTWDRASGKFSKGLGGKGVIFNINADLTGVVNKLSAIESGVDRVNQNIRKTHRGLGHVVNQGVHANTTLSNMGKILDASTNKQGRLAVATSRVRSAINANKRAQDEHNKSIQRGESFMTGLYRKVRNVAMVYGGIQGGLKVLNTADELTRTEARFNLMTGNDKAATAALQESTYQSAMRSRSDYLGTASTVAKLGQRAPGLFASNDDTVQFVENLNKAYKIAGATEQEMWASTLQLSQGLGAGALRGEEFRSVFEAAPNLIRIIAEEMGQPVGKMKDLAAEGKLTSEVIRDALLNATDKINRDFANLPYTWADVWTSMKNVTLRASQPILKLISSITKSTRFINFLGGIERGIKWLMAVLQDLWSIAMPLFRDIYDSLEDVYNYLSGNWGVITGVVRGVVNVLTRVGQTLIDFVVPILKKFYNTIEGIYEFFKQNWGTIEPIVWGIVGAFAAYGTVLAAVFTWTKLVALWTAITNGVMLLVKGTVALVSGVMYLLTGATWAQQAAQWAMNTAMYACPLTWLVLGIIAVIAAIYLAVWVLNTFAGTSISATGIVCGMFMLLYANVYNSIANIWNTVASFVEFFVNVWSEPMYSIKKLFVNLAVGFLDNVIAMTEGWDDFATSFANAMIDAVNWVIEAWNDLMGILPDKIKSALGLGTGSKIEQRVSITSDLKDARDKLKASIGVKPEGYWTAERMELKNVGEYARKGYAFGEEISKLIEGFSAEEAVNKIKKYLEQLANSQANNGNSNTDIQDTMNAANDVANNAANAANDTNKALNGIGKDVKGISNSLDVSEDERKYLYRIAEREAINQMTRNEIKVTMTNNNTMNNETDAKSTMDYLARQLLGQVQSSQEGLAY